MIIRIGILGDLTEAKSTMSLEEIRKTILKISIPLSSEPYYVQVDDPTKKIESILRDVAESFEEDGNPQESVQLLNLMSDHSVYIKNSLVQYSQPVSSLNFDLKTVDDEIIQYAEISLLKQHVGGV